MAHPLRRPIRAHGVAPTTLVANRAPGTAHAARPRVLAVYSMEPSPPTRHRTEMLRSAAHPLCSLEWRGAGPLGSIGARLADRRRSCDDRSQAARLAPAWP